MGSRHTNKCGPFTKLTQYSQRHRYTLCRAQGLSGMSFLEISDVDQVTCSRGFIPKGRQVPAGPWPPLRGHVMSQQLPWIVKASSVSLQDHAESKDVAIPFSLVEASFALSFHAAHLAYTISASFWQFVYYLIVSNLMRRCQEFSWSFSHLNVHTDDKGSC